MHDAYTLGATLAIILIGLLYNGKQIGDLRKEIREDIRDLSTRVDARFNAVDARLDGMHRDLIQLAREQGKHDARLDAIERERT